MLLGNIVRIKNLIRLVDKAVITKQGKGKATYYTITEN